MESRSFDAVVFARGHRYTRHHPVKTGTSYRCSAYRRTKCPGRLIVRHDNTHQLIKEHTCPESRLTTPVTQRVSTRTTMQSLRTRNEDTEGSDDGNGHAGDCDDYGEGDEEEAEDEPATSQFVTQDTEVHDLAALIPVQGLILRERIEDYVDTQSITHLNYTPLQIWKKVYRKFCKDVPFRSRGLTQKQVRSRVSRTRVQRFGGSDPVSHAEHSSLAKVKNTGQPFFQFNFSYYEKQGSVSKLQRLMAWANPILVGKLKAKGTAHFVDGTFRIVPRPFYQCIVIMVFDEPSGLYLPVYHILATGKTEWVYWHALHLVLGIAEFKIRPETTTCDFERALHNAIEDLFPKTALVGSFFHWKQAIRRYMVKISLPEAEVDIAMAHGLLDALTVCTKSRIKTKGIPLVVKRIKAACKAKKTHYSRELWNRFWVYFEQTWLRDFIPDTWNINGLDVELVNRTNNPLERYNRTWNEMFPSPHPSLATFITNIEAMAQDYVGQIEAIERGVGTAPVHQPLYIPPTPKGR